MRKVLPATIALLTWFALGGCSRGPVLARADMTLCSEPIVVQLAKEARFGTGAWDLCLEFATPGDSDHADGVLVWLVDGSGRRRSLEVTRLDRRGERLVSLIGHVTNAIVDPTAGVVPDDGPAPIVAVELAAARPLRLRSLRGGSIARPE